MNKDLYRYLVLLPLIIFLSDGIYGVINYFYRLSITFISILKQFIISLPVINNLSISITGNSIVALIFSYTITFMIVGIILKSLEFYGLMGKYTGKFLYSKIN